MHQETKARIRREIYSDLADEIEILNTLKNLTDPPQDLIEDSRFRILHLRQKLKDLREGRLGRRIQAEAEKKLD